MVDSSVSSVVSVTCLYIYDPGDMTQEIYGFITTTGSL